MGLAQAAEWPVPALKAWGLSSSPASPRKVETGRLLLTPFPAWSSSGQPAARPSNHLFRGRCWSSGPPPHSPSPLNTRAGTAGEDTTRLDIRAEHMLTRQVTSGSYRALEPDIELEAFKAARREG